MKVISTLAISAALFGFVATAQKPTLVKKWETDTLLKVPEAVIYDPANKIIYAANINGDPWGKDGNGFISRITTSGKIEKLQWLTGFDCPKGMAIYNNKLYIADLTRIVIVDIKSSKIENTLTVAGAKQLNDITIDDKGKIYISDSGGNNIYLLENGNVSLWAENKSWEAPNGLLAQKHSLRLADFAGGGFYQVNYKDKNSTLIAKGLSNGDGIVEIGDGEYLVSNWEGEINYVKGETVEKILDTKAAKENAADIWYIPSEKLLLIPTFFGNSVTAYLLLKK